MIIPESYEQFPEGTYGYVYQTTHIPSGKKYVGKKALIYNSVRFEYSMPNPGFTAGVMPL